MMYKKLLLSMSFFAICSAAKADDTHLDLKQVQAAVALGSTVEKVERERKFEDKICVMVIALVAIAVVFVKIRREKIK